MTPFPRAKDCKKILLTPFLTPFPSEIEKTRIAEIRELHAEVSSAARITLSRAIRIGRLLSEQKAELKHGQWLTWVRENLPFDRRTATNYMAIFVKRETISHFTSVADAYRLLSAPSDEERPIETAEVVEEDEELESIFNRCAAEMMEELKGINRPLYRETLPTFDDDCKSWWANRNTDRAMGKSEVIFCFAYIFARDEQDPEKTGEILRGYTGFDAAAGRITAPAEQP